MFRTTEMFFIVLMVAAILGGVTSQNVNCGCLGMQALLTLVQHQTTMIEQQAASMQTLQAEISTLQSSSFQQSQQLQKLRTIVTDMKKGVDERLDDFNAQLVTKANTGKVAFTAHMSVIGVNVGTKAPFIFDKVITNLGNSYNNNSGVFIAPYDGVYVFFFIMINDGAAATIHAQIEQNGRALGVGTSDGLGEYNKWDDGSVLVTTHLKKGDHVYVKRLDGGTRVYGDVYTNFSGFLLSADA